MSDSPRQPLRVLRDAIVETWVGVESTISVLFIFFFLFVLVMAMVPMALYAPGPLRWVPLLILIPDGLFAYWVKKSIEAGHHPIALYLAFHQPRWWLIARPIVACWWAVRFLLAGTVGAMLIHTSWTIEDVEPWVMAMAQLGIFTAIYSSNCYLLLAIAAMTRRRTPVEFVWRWRIVIDALAMATAWFAAPTLLAELHAIS